MEQFEMNFELGLTAQFPDWHDCLRESVYGCGRPFKAVAADLDMSASRLSRMLSENDDANFPAHRLPELIEATGDLRPVYWLAEKFCVDAEQKRRASLERLAALAPEIEALLSSVKGE